MKKYVFRIRQNGEEDGSSVWVYANSESEAEAEVRSEYWGIDDMFLLRVEKA